MRDDDMSPYPFQWYRDVRPQRRSRRWLRLALLGLAVFALGQFAGIVGGLDWAWLTASTGALAGALWTAAWLQWREGVHRHRG